MQLAEIERLYDHENALESGALFALLEHDSALPVYTRLTLPRVKLPKPRIELGCRVGAATGHKRPITPKWLVYHEWDGQLLFQVITAPPAVTATHLSGSDLHGKLRARLRYAVSQFLSSWNSALTTHCVTRIVDSRSDPALESEDGQEISTLAWDIRFNIRTDVWPAGS